MVTRLAALSSLLLFLATPAHATIMTFADGAPIFATGYAEAGMAISAITPPPVDFTYIRDWQSTACCPYSGGTGERELLFAQGDLSPFTTRDFVFSLEANGTFDLSGFDFEDPGFPFVTSTSVTLLASNGNFLSLNPAAFGTLTFGNDFQRINSFTLRCEAGCQATVDNIRFSATAVPEPESYALILTGLGLLGLWRVGRVGKRRSAPAEPLQGPYVYPNRIKS
jgi:hypothetical protein